ncbi:MAG: hypothetical protein ACRBI6_04675 [Acidimicrobiales bacterium]
MITLKDYEDAVTVCRECVYGIPEDAQKREARKAAVNLLRIVDYWNGAPPEVKSGGVEVLIAEEKQRILRFMERFSRSRVHGRDADEAMDELYRWIQNDHHRIESGEL